MCADLLHLEQDLLELQNAHVEYYHLDVMDGHFVDNITLGIDCCCRIGSYPTLRDIHLLVNHPEAFLGRLELKPGEIVQMHYECGSAVRTFADRVHSYGAKVGVVLDPQTQVEQLEPYLDCIDLVTVMMIRPGFAGRPMEDGMLEKITYTRQYLDEHGMGHIIIEVDGHVNVENTPTMYKNGARIVVAGTSSIFRKDVGIGEGVLRLRQCVENQDCLLA